MLVETWLTKASIDCYELKGFRSGKCIRKYSENFGKFRKICAQQCLQRIPVFFISRPHLNEIMDTANAELDQVYQWLIQNRLSLNVKKSKYRIFNKTKTKILHNIALTMNNKPIERVKQFKFLGYHLDETLSWKVHICEIASKIAKNIGLLSKLRKYLNSSTLRNLYFSLIHVHK